MNPQLEALIGSMLGQGLGHNNVALALNASNSGRGSAGTTTVDVQSVLIVGPSPLPVMLVGPGAAQYQQKPPPARAGGTTDADQLGRVASLLAGHFRGLFSPLERLSTYLTPTVSGFGVFQGAMKVVANVIGATLSPILLTLAVGLIEVSDVIWAELRPILTDWFSFMLNIGLPAIREFVGALRWAGTTAMDLWDAPKKHEAELDAFLKKHGVNEAGGITSVLTDAIRGITAEQSGVPEWALRLMSREPGQEAAAKGPGRGKAFEDVIREFQMALGPKSSIQSLSSYRQAGIVSALNFSPFEQRILTIQQDMLKAMQEAAANTREKPAAPTGWNKR